jgi:hypothetical protein
MGRTLRGALAGAVAGVAWKAIEPLLQHEFRSPYSDAGLVSRLVSPSAALAYATQAASGAAFGALFARLGGRGINEAVAAALVENALLWPGVAVVQRHHPDVQSGRWPKPFSDPGAIQVSFTGHAIFGVLLGALLDPPAVRRP